MVPCGSGLTAQVRNERSVSQVKLLCLTLLVALASVTTGASAQTIEIRQWQGANAFMRQPEQVTASTLAEWRSLWARVGARAPDVFEPRRPTAGSTFRFATPRAFRRLELTTALTDRTT